jgi:oxygen-dependent protoporphyrinogen oxidase
MTVARSGVLSAAGLLRASLDVALPRTPIDDDIAVGAYVRARAGQEVVDRLVDPLLGGVYAGRADQLSLAATVPQLAAHVSTHRTLIGAARAARAQSSQVVGPVFAGLVGGRGRVPHAITDVVRAAGVDVRTATTVRELTQTNDGFRLTCGAVPAQQTIETRAVVIAVPGAPAARLLGEIAAAAATEVAAIDYASVVTVTLAYDDADAAGVMHGSGFLVPAVEGRATKAVTYLSAKWSHLSGGLTFVRGSVGRYGDEHDIQRDDDDLVATVHEDLAAVTGLRARPVLSRVNRWGGGLPQYAPGHLGRVRRTRAALPPGAAVCGAAYDGVGVPACVRSGQQAASVLREWLGEQGNRGDEAQGA